MFRYLDLRTCLMEHKKVQCINKKVCTKSTKKVYFLLVWYSVSLNLASGRWWAIETETMSVFSRWHLSQLSVHVYSWAKVFFTQLAHTNEKNQLVWWSHTVQFSNCLFHFVCVFPLSWRNQQQLPWKSKVKWHHVTAYM